jgi:hypothetical protein
VYEVWAQYQPTLLSVRPTVHVLIDSSTYLRPYPPTYPPTYAPIPLPTHLSAYRIIKESRNTFLNIYRWTQFSKIQLDK